MSEPHTPAVSHASDEPQISDVHSRQSDAATILRVVTDRRSFSQVTDQAPTPEELASLVAAAARVADHKDLRPWRLIEMRGTDRERLGLALAAAEHGGNRDHKKQEKYRAKAHRAPLVIAIVSNPHSRKLPEWEQEAVASGVAHTLSLLLFSAGWGVIWRSGDNTRHPEVHRAHGLAPHEQLLGWLYVGGIPEGKDRDKPRKPFPVERFLQLLPPLTGTA